jgi:hypothetical protein
METKIKKVYYCDHCKKHGLSASIISRHEKYCRLKPENRHKCFDMCKFLERKRDIVRRGYDEEPYCGKTVFTCGLTGTTMYSYLLEKRIDFRPEFIKGLVRMPIECNDYRCMNESEYEERFNPSQDD